MIIVVGIGADGMAGLTDSVRAELRGATVIYGSQRQLDLLDDSVGAVRRRWPSPLLPGLRAELDGRTGDVHVVASGDPLLYGIGTTLIRLFGADNVRVLPHISSVALACARMGWAIPETEIISVVTAPIQTAVRSGGRAVVLSRDAGTPAELAVILAETGRGASAMTVLEQLGGPSERRRDGTARGWADAPPDNVDSLNIIAVQYLPDTRILTPLPDDALAHDGQITKRALRAVTLSALAQRPGEVLWDVGAGSGSIAIEWSRRGSGCRAVAFERDEQRRSRIVDNSLSFGVDVDVRGPAPDDFVGAPAPSVVFIGGGVTQPGLLDACLAALPAGGRLVANAVTAESEAVLVQNYSRMGGELQRYQHYRGEPIGGFTGWRPALPVSQWSMVKS